MDERKALLQKYLDGQCTPDEEKQVLNWYYSFTDADEPGSVAAPVNKMRARLLKSVKDQQVIRKSAVTYHWLRIAAILLAVFGAGWFFLNNQYAKTRQQPLAYTYFKTGKGETKQITLTDGTRVYLNAASILKVPAELKTRDLELQGEAYFEVVHDPKKPFTVKAGGLITSDIGTSFDIRAYQDEKDMTVAVVEGEVSVALKHKDIADLKIGKLLSYQHAANAFRVLNADTRQISAWRNGSLYFDGKTIAEITQELERRYNVAIQIKGDGNTCRYTLKLNRGDITRALTLLCRLSGSDWTRQGQQYIIQTQACSPM